MWNVRVSLRITLVDMKRLHKTLRFVIEQTAGRTAFVFTEEKGVVRRLIAENLLKKEVPALEQDVALRPIGGLGIYLVVQMADHCSYARKDDRNIFSACFRMKEAG